MLRDDLSDVKDVQHAWIGVDLGRSVHAFVDVEWTWAQYPRRQLAFTVRISVKLLVLWARTYSYSHDLTLN